MLTESGVDNEHTNNEYQSHSPEVGHDRPTEAEAFYELYDRRAVGWLRVGVFDEASFDGAKADPTSTLARLEGQVVPAITDVKYAGSAGYTTERCARLAGHEDNLYYYTLPDLEAHEVASIAEVNLPEEGHIFLDNNVNDPRRLEDMQQILAASGYVLEELPMEDEFAAEGNWQASIALYGVSLPNADYTSDKQLADTLPENSYEPTPDEPAGPRLIRGETVSDELADKLWDIYQDRFEWLGDKHPVKFEDTKQSFMDLLKSPNTLCSIYFKEGEPMCFAYFMEGLPEWIDEDSIAGELAEGERPLFWPGIVAKQDGVAQYSKPVIQLTAQQLVGNRMPYKVLFENTNRSEGYIPRIIKDYCAGVEVNLEDPECMDRQMYRCFRFTKQTVA